MVATESGELLLPILGFWGAAIPIAASLLGGMMARKPKEQQQGMTAPRRRDTTLEFAKIAAELKRLRKGRRRHKIEDEEDEF